MNPAECAHGTADAAQCEECRYAARVWELELEGLTTSDAQAAADVEFGRIHARRSAR